LCVYIDLRAPNGCQNALRLSERLRLSEILTSDSPEGTISPLIVPKGRSHLWSRRDDLTSDSPKGAISLLIFVNIATPKTPKCLFIVLFHQMSAIKPKRLLGLINQYLVYTLMIYLVRKLKPKKLNIV